MFNRILVVCVGNICRNQMAEGLLVQTLSEAGMQAIQIRSTGLNTLVGHQADKIAIRLMLEQGVDVSAHRGPRSALAIGYDSHLATAMFVVRNVDVA